MSITTDLDAWWADLKDYQESNSAKAKFQEIMSTIDQMLDELKAMYDAGDYNQLPDSVKTKFVWAWGQLDDARDTVKADSDFMTAINWKP